MLMMLMMLMMLNVRMVWLRLAGVAAGIAALGISRRRKLPQVRLRLRSYSL